MHTLRLAISAVLILLVYTYTNICDARPNAKLNNGNWISESPGRNWLFGIGISDYDSNTVWKDLKNAKGDMATICGELQSEYHFSKKNAIILSDSLATRRNILDTLRFLAKSIREKDNLIIYFAGHGYYSEKTDMGFWIPSDAGSKTSSFISCEQLRANGLATNSALHVVLFIDACYSSSIFDDRRAIVVSDSAKRVSCGDIIEDHDSTGRGQAGMTPDGQISYLEILNQTPSREAFVSGRLSTVTDGGGEHSPFAFYVNEFLTGSKAAFTMDMMAGHVLPQVYEACGQVPRYGHLRVMGDEGGNFVFAKVR
jgi:hypothetical protein